MKIAEQQHSVKIEGNVEVQEFGFIFNAKMVKLLSDNLYNDKIGAIVREISTNAWDSHVEAGNQDKPFDVHMPTYEEPYFYVRDYGTGMSPKRIKEIYIFYGASDRTESNEFTGGMGLGSKVPFCYNTHTFTVDSWYGGVHTCYSCFIGEDGKPNIATMSSAPSNDPPGVMIKLQVSSSDFNNFNFAVENIYPIFPVTPRFIGRKQPAIRKPNYSLSANDGSWKLRGRDGEGCRVIMGNVAYPVNIHDANVTSAQRAVMQSDFDLFAEVGSLTVDIGREGLSYDNRTRVRVTNMLNKVVTDYNQRIQEEVSKSPNLWEARRKFTELYDKAELRVMDGSQIQYNGHKLFDRSGYHLVNLESLVSVKKDPITYKIISQPVAKITSISIGWRAAKYEKNERINTISPAKKLMFFENDLSIGSYVRAAHIAKQEGCAVLLFHFNDAAARKAVCEALGCDDSYFKPISSIPSPTVRGSNGPRGTFGRVVMFNQNIDWRNNSVTEFWQKDQDIDFDEDSGVYVEFNRFNYRAKNGILNVPQALASIIRQAKDCGIKIPNIYGVKTADIDRVKHNPNWTDFFTLLAKEVTNLLPNVDLTKIQYYQKQLKRICNISYSERKNGNSRLDADSIKRIGRSCKTQNKFMDFVNAIDMAQTETKHEDMADDLFSLANTLGVAIPKYAPFVPVELDKMEREVYNKYTMLGFLDYSVFETTVGVNKVASYIDSIS